MNRIKIYLTTLILCVVFSEAYSQYYPTSWHETGGVGDVMNVYQYSRICPYEFQKIIPFFRPSSKNFSTCLVIDIYTAEEYYGEYVKASEYPMNTYKAYYNIYGCLYKVDDDTKEHHFKYDQNGILVTYCCYDKNTGKLIKEKTEKVPFNISDSNSNSWTVIKNMSGEYWYLYRYGGNYETSSTPFLNIPFKDGFHAYYNLALRCNFPGQRMLVLKDGEEYVSPEWLRKHIPGNWKKRNTQDVAYRVFRDRDFGKKTTRYYYYYNEVGLTGNECMTLSECISHGVRNNKWYEYQWINN